MLVTQLPRLLSSTRRKFKHFQILFSQSVQCITVILVIKTKMKIFTGLFFLFLIWKHLSSLTAQVTFVRVYTSAITNKINAGSKTLLYKLPACQTVIS